MPNALPKLTTDAVTGAGPIRLAFVITELLPGGAERCLVELATGIDRSRFTPVVYSLGPLPPDGRRLLVQRLREAEIPTHFLDLRFAWQYFAGVRRLAALLRGQRAEIVQTFLFHANVLGARAARSAGSPHLLTGMRVADPRRCRLALERWATSTADRFVCVSQDVREFCRAGGFASEKLVVIPNGIDVARWRDAPSADLQRYGVPPGRRVFAYVGRLDEQKGLAGFFQQLPGIFRELPNHDFFLVGDGMLQPALQRQARQLAVAERVHFAGWQPEVPTILAAAELLVLPSQWEGMPNAVLEAMAAGKPVVAARAQGISDLLGDAANEQTTPVGHFEELRVKLGEIISNQPLAKDLGHRNQARAVAEFSLVSMIQRYENEYLTLPRR